MKKFFWYILSILQFGSEARTSNLIKKLWLFEKKGNANVKFCMPTNELKDYSDKQLLKQKSIQRL